MTITKKIILEVNDDMIDSILKELHKECDFQARVLLDNAGLDELEWDEYLKYKEKLTKEIFDDVVTKLIFDSKEG